MSYIKLNKKVLIKLNVEEYHNNKIIKDQQTSF